MSRNPARHVVSAIALIGAVLHASPSQAQISTDGSLGAKQALSGPVFNIPDSLGQPVGPNLFHSFDTFNVHAGEKAIFTGPSSIVNVISRVTGVGQVSTIDGLIDTKSSMKQANFFLLNPNGVMLGPNAQLNIGGAFHVSTADYLCLKSDKCVDTATRNPTGEVFFARLGDTSVFTASPPAAFGFLGAAPARLVVDGSKLTVQNGFSLIGGEVAITGATLAAPGGRVQIASLSSGEVTLDGRVAPSSRLGPIAITGNSLIGATGYDDSGVIGLGSGTVIIRGGQLLVDASTILAHTWEDVAGPRGIDIQVTGNVVLTNGARISSITFVADRGGDVTITADRLRLEKQSLIETKAFAGATPDEGHGGDVTATVGRLDVADGSSINSTTDFGMGQGGNITLEADTITISGRDSANNPSRIFSHADPSGSGNGGNVSIRPRSSTLDLSLYDGGSIESTTQGGNGGAIDIHATNVSLLGGATISSQTLTPAPGGSIALTANSVTISGADSSNPSSRSGILSGSLGAGEGRTPGTISVTATDFSLTQGGVIQSGGFFAPEAGDIQVAATNSLVIASGGTISSQAFAQPGGQVSLGSSSANAVLDGGFVNTSTIGAGAAGNVVINVRTLTMSSGAQVASSSSGASGGSGATGPGGGVTVTAHDSVSITGRGASINSFTNDASTGLFSTTASTVSLGAAGTVTVSAPTLTITNGGKISVESTGVAAAGDISLTLGTLTLSGGGGLFSNTTSSGPGGNIAVQAGQVQLASGATISASSSGTGLAGSVTIQATTFQTQDSFVTTTATQADGGDIDILVGSLVYLTGSEITTSVGSGAGKGGNITIDPQFVVLNNSQILANAFGGPGGNITIVTDVFLSSGSIVNASSTLSAPGTISIDARITDLSGSLLQLPDNVLQGTALLRAACTARVAEGKASSLVVAGREGVPPEPLGLLWSPLGATLLDLSTTPSEAQGRELLPRFAGVWLGSNCAR